MNFSQNDNISNIQNLIQELQHFQSQETPFSLIEKDILLQLLREAYLHISTIETATTKTQQNKEIETPTLNNNGFETVIAIEADIKPESDAFKEEEKQEEAPYSTLNSISEIKQVAENEFFKENIIEKEEEIFPIEEQKPTELFDANDLIEFVMPHEEDIKLKSEQQYVNQQFQQEKEQVKSLNDLLGANKEEKSLNMLYQNAKISDLTKSISINDKFLFIRELFQNKGEEFSKAIQSLNNTRNIEEAFQYMEILKKQYLWDSTSPAYLSFCDLVRRKF